MSRRVRAARHVVWGGGCPPRCGRCSEAAATSSGWAALGWERKQIAQVALIKSSDCPPPALEDLLIKLLNIERVMLRLSK